MEDINKLTCKILTEMQTADGKYNLLSHEDVLPYVMYAQSDICLYLRTKPPLGDELVPVLCQLAKLKVAAAHISESQLKSRSYSEGEISESETFLTAEDIERREKELLSSLAPRRRCRIVT